MEEEKEEEEAYISSTLLKIKRNTDHLEASGSDLSVNHDDLAWKRTASVQPFDNATFPTPSTTLPPAALSAEINPGNVSIATNSNTAAATSAETLLQACEGSNQLASLNSPTQEGVWKGAPIANMMMTNRHANKKLDDNYIHTVTQTNDKARAETNPSSQPFHSQPATVYNPPDPGHLAGV